MSTVAKVLISQISEGKFDSSSEKNNMAVYPIPF